MGQSTQDNECVMVKGRNYILMGLNIMEIGLKIKKMAKEFLHMQMVLNMKDNGRKTNNMEKGLKFRLMELDMREIISLGKSMEKVCYFMVMEAHIKVSLYKMTSKVLAFIVGQMEESILVNGLEIKCMETGK